jgi:hypothetical protein
LDSTGSISIQPIRFNGSKADQAMLRKFSRNDMFVTVIAPFSELQHVASARA